ncbi:hypothetical protein ACF09Y_22420 [Streptomyces massasporeus]|uniref:hypothetical protein n=1 Tax=Streptomyces massasporeus TaxID=67324 RepID=UPI0036F8E8B2
MTDETTNRITYDASNHDSLFISSDKIQAVKLAPPPILEIRSNSGQPLVTIHPDGRLEHGDDYQPDEAAQAFWDAVQRLVPPAMVREYGAPLTTRINAELAAGQRAQRQQRNWGNRERTLGILRRARVTQKEHGEWPAAGAQQDGARS